MAGKAGPTAWLGWGPPAVGLGQAKGTEVRSERGTGVWLSWRLPFRGDQSTCDLASDAHPRTLDELRFFPANIY